MPTLPPAGPPTARCLYAYENRDLQAIAILARADYAYVNVALQAIAILARSLYDFENRGMELLAVLARATYEYEAARETTVFPWLEKILPNQQFPLGQVDLYGDGLGQYAEVGAGSTITASSTSGSNIPGHVATRSSSDYWQSTDGTTAWIRFTFATAQQIHAIALEDLNSDLVANERWGTPLFRFSDGGADVIAGSLAPIPTSFVRSGEYPVGGARTLYVLPTDRTVTWIEVRVSSAGAGSARGLSQVWIYADQGVAAETSVVTLGELGELMGIVAWTGRSVGLWPANGGIPTEPAGTVTVPADAESGLVRVVEGS